MATIFGHEAKRAGVKKIVHLGGMVPDLPEEAVGPSAQQGRG